MEKTAKLKITQIYTLYDKDNKVLRPFLFVKLNRGCTEGKIDVGDHELTSKPRHK